MLHPPGQRTTSGSILDDRFVSYDGTALPLKQWSPEPDKTKAVLIALHGFNDYSNFFQQPGSYFKNQGIHCYAYDQRGFGASPKPGFWSGVEAYKQDLHLFVQRVREKHPDLPLFLLGESMGGAVAIVTAAFYPNLPINGLILAAPAVWARQTMPWYQRFLLSALAHTLPWLTVTGASLEIQASDNIEMLNALSRDPLVIKETRIDAIYGLANLMDAALLAAENTRQTTLLLYGEHDQIIPMQATTAFLRQFMRNRQQSKTLALYPQGYHMLLRDRQAPLVWQDIYNWIQHPGHPLPSRADRRGLELLDTFTNSGTGLYQKFRLTNHDNVYVEH